MNELNINSIIADETNIITDIIESESDKFKNTSFDKYHTLKEKIEYYKLNLPLNSFKHYLETSNIIVDHTLIEFILEKSPKHIKYLDEYYNHFNLIDINIVKKIYMSNSLNIHEYYNQIDLTDKDQDSINHVNNFIRTNKLTNNIFNLFNNIQNDNSEKHLNQELTYDQLSILKYDNIIIQTIETTPIKYL